MGVLRQRRLWRRADAQRRRVGGAKLGVRALELLQFAEQLVVLLVGDDRPVEHVIVVRRLLNAAAKFGGASRELAQVVRRRTGRVGWHRRKMKDQRGQNNCSDPFDPTYRSIADL